MSMAESTKRQNNPGGKAPVATPNVGQLVALETAMSGAIGGRSVTELPCLMRIFPSAYGFSLFFLFFMQSLSLL